MRKKICILVMGIIIMGLCGCQSQKPAAKDSEATETAAEAETDLENADESTENAEEAVKASDAKAAAEGSEAAADNTAADTKSTQTTTVQVEGSTESVPAQTVKGSYGYTITYDSSRFTFGPAEDADTITPVSEDTASVGNVYMAISEITEYNLEDAVAGLILQTGYDGEAEDITIGANAYPAKAFFYQEGDGPEAMIREYYCVEKSSGVLLIEIGFPSEAAEGYGARLDSIVDTLTLN